MPPNQSDVLLMFPQIAEAYKSTYPFALREKPPKSQMRYVACWMQIQVGKIPEPQLTY